MKDRSEIYKAYFQRRVLLPEAKDMSWLEIEKYAPVTSALIKNDCDLVLDTLESMENK